MGLSPVAQTVLLLIASNFFMNYAWYGHLEHIKTGWWMTAVLVSWGVAFFEYSLQGPANRIGAGAGGMSFGQLKILQEVISISVFVPVSLFVLGQPLKLDYLWAALCMGGALFFVFREELVGG